MAQRTESSHTEDDVSFRSGGSQFRNAQERMNSTLVTTGGVIPGSVPRMIGDQAFVKHRITKFYKDPPSGTGNQRENFAEDTTTLQTDETLDNNLTRNREQLEKLKYQLAEKEKNKSKGSSSSSAVGASFEFSHPATRAPRSAAVVPAATKVLFQSTSKVEAQAELLGIIEVLTPLRSLPSDKKKVLAQMSLSAVVNETPNIEEDGLELGSIFVSNINASVVMEREFVSITIANAFGGGVYEMSRYALSQVGVVVHTRNDMVVFIGRDAMSRRTAVILKIPNLVEFNSVVARFKTNTKN